MSVAYGQSGGFAILELLYFGPIFKPADRDWGGESGNARV